MLLRTTLAIKARVAGPDGEDTLVTEGRLAGALLTLGEFAEAVVLGRGTLEKRRRILGPEHRDTLVTAPTWRSLTQGKLSPLRP